MRCGVVSKVGLGFVVVLVCVGFVAAQSGQIPTGQMQSGFGDRPPVIVPRDSITAAMYREALRGYDIVPVPNSGRLFSAVVLDLARRAHSNDPDGPPLMLRHGDWFGAFLEVAGLPFEDAPIAKRIAYENRQDVFINFNRDDIFEAIDPDENVEFAVNIEISWSDEPGRPDSFSFDDTTSVPHVQVTNHRIVRFRILDLGDMIVFDDIEGITGRPSTGLLAALFKVIGEGSLQWSRIAITDGGTTIGRAQAKKLLFTVTETVTVYPDGQAMKGLPAETPEFLAIESRLKEELDFEYVDW